MEVVIPIVSSLIIAGGSAFYSYLQSKKIKSAEAKITVGEEQLKKILNESDIQIKYLYRLQNICTEFKQVLSGIFNRQYEKPIDILNKEIKFGIYFFNDLLSLNLFDKLNNVIPEKWEKELNSEFTGAIKPWDWNQSYNIVSNQDILIFLYSLSKLLAWIEIKKKDDRSVYAYASKKGKIREFLNKFANILNIENDRKINISMLLQKEIGGNMLEKNPDTSELYKSIDFITFKDKVLLNNQVEPDNDKIRILREEYNQEVRKNKNRMIELEKKLRELIDYQFHKKRNIEDKLNKYKIYHNKEENTIEWKFEEETISIDILNSEEQNFIDRGKYTTYEREYIDLEKNIEKKNVIMKDIKLVLFDKHNYEGKEVKFNYGVVCVNSDKQKKLEEEMKLLSCFNIGRKTIFEQLKNIFSGADKIRDFLKIDEEPERNYEEINIETPPLTVNFIEEEKKDNKEDINNAENVKENKLDNKIMDPMDLFGPIKIENHTKVNPPIQIVIENKNENKVSRKIVPSIPETKIDSEEVEEDNMTYLWQHSYHFMGIFNETIFYYNENVLSKYRYKKMCENDRKKRVALRWGQLDYYVEKYYTLGEKSAELLFDLEPSPALGKKCKIDNVRRDGMIIAERWLDFFIKRVGNFEELKHFFIPYYNKKCPEHEKGSNYFWIKKNINTNDNQDEDNILDEMRYQEARSDIEQKKCLEIFKDIFYEFIVRSKYNTLDKLDNVMEQIIEETDRLISEDLQKRNNLLNG
tara:strand:+ start:709 stop:2961 length:2253 start_codon:yes stop_codon:yes gene_type:complete